MACKRNVFSISGLAPGLCHAAANGRPSLGLQLLFLTSAVSAENSCIGVSTSGTFRVYCRGVTYYSGRGRKNFRARCLSLNFLSSQSERDLFHVPQKIVGNTGQQFFKWNKHVQ